jgi:hypothetical protein
MTKIIDLDEQLGFTVDQEPSATKKVRLFGRDWTINCGVNVYHMSAMANNDLAAVHQFFQQVVAHDEFDAFSSALSSIPNMDGDKLSKVVFAIFEAAAERPTKSPRASTPTATRRTSEPKSREPYSSDQVYDDEI